jgi:CDP-glycerol glycerophosphotransferase (TagB/SpsB family)
MNIKSTKKVWIFGSWLGTRYADNSKYLFEYVCQHGVDYAVWMTKNKTVYDTLKKDGKNVMYFYSWESFVTCLKANYLVISVAYDDIPLWSYILSPGALLVNLWHGTPLKQLNFRRTFFNALIRKVLILFLGREADVVISASSRVSEVLKNYFLVKDRNFLVTGYPRNDGLFKVNSWITQKNGLKYVLFMPTFRDYAQDVNLFEDYNFDTKTVVDFLKKNNIRLFIKMHPKDVLRSTKIFKTFAQNESSTITILSDSVINDDIYSFLGAVDVLITDYSSVYFDFLLLDRPIIFSSFDIQRYISNDRGFYFEYNTVTPGRKVRDWNEVLHELESIFSGADVYRKDRENLNLQMNTYRDHLNSKRVYDVITKQV